MGGHQATMDYSHCPVLSESRYNRWHTVSPHAHPACVVTLIYTLSRQPPLRVWIEDTGQEMEKVYVDVFDGRQTITSSYQGTLSHESAKWFRVRCNTLLKEESTQTASAGCSVRDGNWTYVAGRPSHTWKAGETWRLEHSSDLRELNQAAIALVARTVAPEDVKELYSVKLWQIFYPEARDADK